MRERHVRLGLTVPCFNEAERWDDVYWDAVTSLSDVVWVFVDDGSSDGTMQRLEGLAERPNVIVLHCPENRGKAEAVRAGMQRLLGEDLRTGIVGFMDADGAFPPTEVERLRDLALARLAEAEATDAVWSSRVALAGRSVDRRAARHYLGRIVATFLFRGVPGAPYDSQSGWKAFRADARLGRVLEQPFRTRWLFEVEMLARWGRSHGVPMQVREEPVEAWRDVTGSKIRGREIVRLLREVLVARHVFRGSLFPRAEPRAGESWT